MIALKNAKILKNIKADVAQGDWPAMPVYNAVPDSSEAGAACHIYLTAAGLIFWRPKNQVVIPMAELKAAVKAAEDDFNSPPNPPVLPLKKPTPPQSATAAK
jgi:hypothetical protein